jgi:hypothetical protein
MRSLALLLACSCASAIPPTQRFVLTDQGFDSAPRPEKPRILFDLDEMEHEPPFKSVGILEIRGNSHDSINAFLARVAEAGARSGCEVLAQRDLFELTASTDLAQPQNLSVPGSPRYLPTRSQVLNGVAVWQFLCGVQPATPQQAAYSRRVAIARAISLRDKELGEVCRPSTPLGSHVHTRRVCANY